MNSKENQTKIMINTFTIPNFQAFIQQLINGTRFQFIDEATLLKTNDMLKDSTILECKFNNDNIGLRKYKKRYRRLLLDLYSIINDSEISKRGCNFSSSGALKTIIDITKIKHYSIELKIKLQSNDVIRVYKTPEISETMISYI